MAIMSRTCLRRVGRWVLLTRCSCFSEPFRSGWDLGRARIVEEGLQSTVDIAICTDKGCHSS
jgi:hypothetical protein